MEILKNALEGFVDKVNKLPNLINEWLLFFFFLNSKQIAYFFRRAADSFFAVKMPTEFVAVKNYGMHIGLEFISFVHTIWHH